MNRAEMAVALAALGEAYRVEISDEQVGVWHGVVGVHSVEAVSLSVRRWIESEERFPTPAALARVARLASSTLSQQQNERMLNDAPTVCAGCEGYGMRPVEVNDGSFAVTRCYCRPDRKPVTEHAKGCSCGSCRYGPAAWARISSGRDGTGLGPRTTQDPLQVKPSFEHLRDATGEERF